MLKDLNQQNLEELKDTGDDLTLNIHRLFRLTSYQGLEIYKYCVLATCQKLLKFKMTKPEITQSARIT